MTGIFDRLFGANKRRIQQLEAETAILRSQAETHARDTALHQHCIKTLEDTLTPLLQDVKLVERVVFIGNGEPRPFIEQLRAMDQYASTHNALLGTVTVTDLNADVFCTPARAVEMIDLRTVFNVVEVQAGG